MVRFLTPEERAQIANVPLGEPGSVPAPITGWNTRDALTNMEPTDAITLDNWYPDYGGCLLRNGYTAYTTAALAAAPVKTLMEYWAGSTHKFIAACGGKLIDITTAVSPVALKTGLGSDTWSSVMFSKHLFLANATDNAQVFDGSTMADFGGTGVTLANIAGFFVYQNFLICWLANDTKFYYLPGSAISGGLSSFDLSTLSEFGGNLVAVTSFSNDGGDGVFSFVCFIMSSGETIIFSGTNPSDATAWSLVAKYKLSAPVNARAVARYGGETYLTTADDHVPLQQQLAALRLGQAPPRSKVSGAVAKAVIANPNGQGWQALYYGKGRRVLFNIPNTDGTFDQHVYNTATQAWCRFRGMNGWCLGIYNGNLYFGDGTGNVWLADSGSLDAGVQAIQADGQTAWNLFTTELRKKVNQTRAMMQTLGSAAYNFGVGFDYAVINVGAPVAPTNTGSPWNTSPWNTSPWSPETNIDPTWRGAGGTGQSISFRVTAASTLALTWLRNDFIMEPGATQ